jgi:hypothetical protein
MLSYSFKNRLKGALFPLRGNVRLPQHTVSVFSRHKAWQ